MMVIKPGLNAAYKASLLLSNSQFNGGVVIFTDGQDPADMVNGNKIDELNAMFSDTIPFIDFVIDFIINKYDLKNPQDKQTALQESNDYLKTLSPILTRGIFLLNSKKIKYKFPTYSSTTF